MHESGYLGLRDISGEEGRLLSGGGCFVIPRGGPPQDPRDSQKVPPEKGPHPEPVRGPMGLVILNNDLAVAKKIHLPFKYFNEIDVVARK